MDFTVNDVPERNRYEATSPDGVVGVLEYRRAEGVIFLDHAEVEPAFRGRGIAAVLVLEAMQAARAAGVTVIPICGYVRNWVSEHPEWG